MKRTIRAFCFQVLSGFFAAAILTSLLGGIPASRAADAEKSARALTLWQLPNATPSQMMAYVLQADDGSVIVLDGGTAGDAEQLVAKIKELRPDGRVAAWFLTHLHIDHVGALDEILRQKRADLSIDYLYYSFPPMEWFEKNTSKGEIQEARDFYQVIPSFDEKKRGPLGPGEKRSFGSVTIEALNDYDPSIVVNPVNNSDVVYRLETPKTSILFLGDLGVEAGKRLLGLVPAEKIKADVVQMAHHGQNGVTKEFYDVVSPKACLWCSPDWLWDNNQGGKGSGSGPWKTIQNRAWMDDLGIKTHYVIKDGPIKLEFE